MKFSVVLFALASYLASAAPTGPSPDAPGLSKKALPADSIKARMSDDAVKSARHSAGLNPDVIEAPYYLTGELQERAEALNPDVIEAPYYLTGELQERSAGLNPDVIEAPYYLVGELQE
ncbi:hypothetical protein MGU_07797 [Metarhizium guizhouense ARSEF 977]|uniref:Uncharacterized protein n=1 Tax=Metarhizium guizhouense (strain ARSEF 977) TaxID=1276136 RepID=A0A0B4HZ12_METGA|nr:hypothetical protein MGU_07797 [Metarhizium guizhouense ARSEF 977]